MGLSPSVERLSNATWEGEADQQVVYPRPNSKTVDRPFSRPELFPIHSQLLRVSLLVSFPPLNDMLKFSG